MRDRDVSFRLGEWLVEPALNRVSKGDRVVRLQPRAMEVLRCLAEREGEVVSRQEIIDAVWPEEFVGDAAVSAAVVKLRRALGDDARAPHLIETVPKRGYRLVGPVRWLDRPVRQGVVPEIAYPPSLDPGDRPEPSGSVFVGRRRELGRLEVWLDAAVAGEGRVAFVTGEAGTGKTSLVQELTRRSMERHPELAAVSAFASAVTGLGDPYAPFRQVLAQLSGDVEPRLASGALSREQARRLWQLIPATCRAITESGPDLVGTLVSGASLLARATAAAVDGESWLTGVRELVARKASLPPDVGLQQAAVFAELSRVLCEISRQRPLLVVIDDLHWADSGSLALLAHLGREVAGSRVLVAGTFRPEEAALGRGRERHPLEQVVHEVARTFGECQVALGQSGSREFVDAVLDSEPNRLGDAFRERLFARTQGHALFTVELLRSLEERGVIVRGDDGRWVEGGELDWQRLPARVEGVIGERIGRLSERSRDLLAAASVEGSDFTVEVLARLRGEPVGEVVRLLSQELERRHRLVQARGLRDLPAGRLSLFGFSHVLFQHYLYGTLNEVERAHLHGEVGALLEALYGEESDEIAPQLAWHFEQAGDIERAVHHLHRAGLSCTRRTAHEEAIAHLEKALDLLATLPPSAERDARELELRMAVQTPLIALHGWAHPRVGDEVSSAHRLAEGVGDPGLMARVLLQVCCWEMCAASLPRAMATGERILAVAEELDDDSTRIVAHLELGLITRVSGQLERSRAHLEQGWALYDPSRHHQLAHLVLVDPGVACRVHLMNVVSHLGHPDLAVELAVECLEMARRLGHPPSLAMAQFSAFWPLWHRRELRQAEQMNAALRATIDAHGLDSFRGYESLNTGTLHLAGGRPEPALEALARGVEIEKGNGVRLNMGDWLVFLAWAHLEVGDHGQAQVVLDQAADHVATFGEHYVWPFFHLVRAQVLLEVEGEAAVEACLLKGLDVARAQRARWVELVLATTLARLWQGRGRRREAREVLQPVYDWFTEGLDTQPLEEAKALLDELA